MGSPTFRDKSNCLRRWLSQIDEVAKVLAGGLTDMVFTDPPYAVNYNATMKDKLRGKTRKIADDNLGEAFGPFLYAACANFLSAAKGAVCICKLLQPGPACR